jgi:hypothetical protein
MLHGHLMQSWYRFASGLVWLFQLGILTPVRVPKLVFVTFGKSVPENIAVNPFQSHVGPRPTLWFSCSRRVSWSLTLSNPIFLPAAYSPPPIYFERERGWWITCNYPTVLKQKKINRNLKSTTCAVCWLTSVLHDEKRFTHHVTTHNTPIHNILSTAPQLSFSQKALETLPEDGNVMPKHVGATIHN